MFDEWTTALADRLVDDGYSDSDARRDRLMTVAGIEGAVIVAQARRSTEPLEVMGAVLSEMHASRRPS